MQRVKMGCQTAGAQGLMGMQQDTDDSTTFMTVQCRLENQPECLCYASTLQASKQNNPMLLTFFATNCSSQLATTCSAHPTASTASSSHRPASITAVAAAHQTSAEARYFRS
jgi:hypothetical protein